MKKDSLKNNGEDSIDMKNNKDIDRQTFYNHIEKYAGKISSVFTEIVSDYIGVDVVFVNPTEERPFYTLITYGMSKRPMNIPQGYDKGYEKYKYEELMLCLPEDWQLTNESIQNEKWYWPIRLLKILAKKPHKENAFLTFTHIVPYDPNERYVLEGKRFAENVEFNNSLIFIPTLFNPKFKEVHINDNKVVKIMSVIPIYEEEQEYAKENGIMKLIEKYDEIDFSELVNLNRVNVCR